MHVTWLMGVTEILAQNRDKWRGTVMAVFQPAEETGEGARAMVEDGMVKRFPKPDITLARTLLDWEPKVSLEQGLGRTIDYFKQKVLGS